MAIRTCRIVTGRLSAWARTPGRLGDVLPESRCSPSLSMTAFRNSRAIGSSAIPITSSTAELGLPSIELFETPTTPTPLPCSVRAPTTSNRGPRGPPVPPEMFDLGRPTAMPIEEAKAMHPAFYTDERYFQAEVSQVFGSSWFAAAHVAELSKPGDMKVVDVGDASFILTRDKSGKLHAFYNVCRHRGARVCSESKCGTKQLVCPYHWWTYRLDGSLKSAPPAMIPQEKKDKLGLIPVPGVETFAGIIFLNQQPHAPPLVDQLGDLPEKLARYDLEEMSMHKQKNYNIGGNWKLIAENFVDFYHVNSVHPALAKFSKVDDHIPYQGSGQYVGFVTMPLTNSAGPADLGNFNAFPRLNSQEQQSALFFHIFPNVSVTLYPHSVYTLIALPGERADRTNESLALFMPRGAQKESEQTAAFEAKKDNLMDFVCTVNDEDVVAIENLQRGLKNAKAHDMVGELLPKYDWPIHRFQNMVLNSLGGARLNDLLMPQLINADI